MAMKTKITSFLFFFFVSVHFLVGQTVSDSLIITQIRWDITSIAEGLVCKQAEIPDLYAVPQHITVLEIDPKEYRFDLVVGDPKVETSVAGRSTDAVAAINGSYFNVKEGHSVCYLRKDKAVVDTTTTGEFNLRVTGAVRIRKGKIEVLPWNKEAEVSYRKKRGIVLASGPLMLNRGTICDFSSCGKGFIETKHPRSAIAQTKEGKVLLITVDGRFPGKAEGIRIPELAHLIRVLGGWNALNLDGGGSTTLWAAETTDNGVLNKLCDNKKYDNNGERKVANVICVYRK